MDARRNVRTIAVNGNKSKQPLRQFRAAAVKFVDKSLVARDRGRQFEFVEKVKERTWIESLASRSDF